MKALLKKKKNSFSERVRKKTEGIKGLFSKIVLITNLAFVAVLLFSYLSVYINPSIFAFPAFFGLAYPYLLLINVIFAVFWISLWKREAFISIAAILLGIGYMHNFIRLSNQGEEVKTDIKLFSYNVRLFNYYEGAQVRSSEKKILQMIKRENPGIICLQEYFVPENKSTSEVAIKDALGGTWYSHTKLISNKGNKAYGIITLSRYPIINRGEIIHPNSSSLTIFSDIVTGDDTIRIFNNHLQSFRLKKLDSSFIGDLSAEETKTLKDIRYFYRRLANGFESRSAQTEKLKKSISKSPYPVIVAGDFNDTPISYTYRKIHHGLNDAFVKAGYGAGFTYRGKYPPNRIDFIFYNNKLDCTDFDIIKVKYSDHYPVVAYFRKSH
jgi:endonuclease/exonuclease/phosphatase family metal-dependent hydrolase